MLSNQDVMNEFSTDYRVEETKKLLSMIKGCVESNENTFGVLYRIRLNEILPKKYLYEIVNVLNDNIIRRTGVYDYNYFINYRTDHLYIFVLTGRGKEIEIDEGFEKLHNAINFAMEETCKHPKHNFDYIELDELLNTKIEEKDFDGDSDDYESYIEDDETVVELFHNPKSFIKYHGDIPKFLLAKPTFVIIDSFIIQDKYKKRALIQTFGNVTWLLLTTSRDTECVFLTKHDIRNINEEEFVAYCKAKLKFSYIPNNTRINRFGIVAKTGFRYNGRYRGLKVDETFYEFDAAI